MKKKITFCWICGDIATTGEHSQKKTDVTSMFGKGSYKATKIVKYDLDQRAKTYIQGPNSATLKYNKNLCKKCNNERTQPYDEAYELFAEFITTNFQKIKINKEINTNIVFGKDKAKKQQKNLFLYFMKAFGSQLNDKGLAVPQELKEALLGKSYSNVFRISICINAKRDKLQNFPLLGFQDSNRKPVNYYWAQNTGWFIIIYAYNRPIALGHGSEWYGKSRKLCTGELRDAEQHLWLGIAYENLSRYQEAIEEYRQAIKLKPDLAEAHYSLGVAYLAIGDKGSALEEYKILKTLNPKRAEQLFNLISKPQEETIKVG